MGRLSIALCAALLCGLLTTCIPKKVDIAATDVRVPNAAEHRTVFPYAEALYPDSLPASEAHVQGRYARLIKKQDIIYFGKRVSIDSIERTNGGDVVIFADSVEINAPIDTRVYLDHSAEDVEQAYAPYNCKMPATVGRPEPYLAFYQGTNDVWDNKKKQYVFGNAAEYPEMPQGFTPCAGNGRGSYSVNELEHRGTIKFDRATLQSGNIVIFANKISFCKDCLPNDQRWDGSKPDIPRCSAASPFQDRTLLNARGIRGSRGFAGGYSCPESWHYGASCEVPGPIPWQNYKGFGDDFRRGATDGGTGGTVEIFFVNNVADADLEVNPAVPFANRPITSRSDVRGGDPGSTTSFETPCSQDAKGFWKCDPVPQQHAECWFKRTDGSASKRPPAQPVRGEGGQLTIGKADPAAALVGLADKLRELELSRQYSFEGSIEEARAGRLIRRLTPSGLLDAYLDETARAAMHEQTVRSQNLAIVPAATPLPAILAGLSYRDDDYLGLSDHQLKLVRILWRLDHSDSPSDTQGSLRGFFERTGGLLRVSNPDPARDVKLREILTKLQDIQAEIGKLKLSVKQFHYDFYGYARKQEEAAYTTKLENLQRALEEAQRKVDEANDPAGKFKGVTDKLSSIAGAVKDVVAAWKASDVQGVLKPVGGIATDIRDIVKVLEDDPNIRPQEIRDLIAATEKAYREFADETRRIQDGMIADQQAVVADLLKMETVTADLATGDLLLFEDLYRSAMLTRLGNETVAGNQQYLTNLGELRKLVTLGTHPQFSMPSYLTNCTTEIRISQVPSSSGLIDCVQTEKFPQPSILRVRSDIPDSFASFPLIVVPANAPDAKVPAFKLFAGQRLEFAFIR